MQEKPEYERFRYNGLPYARELAIIFKNKAASGDYKMTPSSSQPQKRDEKTDEYY